jgi:hypothetical protein
MKKILALLLFAIVISSCSLYTFYPNEGSNSKYKPTSPKDILILSGDLDRKYIVLGSIAVDVVGSNEKLREVIKEKAASLGANAVINVELSKISSNTVRTGMSGVAIRYLD